MKTTYIIIFIVAIVIFFLIRFIRRRRYNYAKAKGRHGEKQVAQELTLLPDEYTIFNDVYILENGKSTQIDHIVLSPYGIFVIETKNYSGWIYGGEKAQYWTKNMYGRKYPFYNPLLQNYSHVKALHSLFGFPMQYFIPIVVFTDYATLKGNYPRHNVINIGDLNILIKTYQNVVFREDILAAAINKLTYSSFKTSKTVSNHEAQVKANIESQRRDIMEGVCPRCGGSLVHKEGKYGSFWGCSNYPKCRYTLKR
ncbi:MAG: NERD domain-containing protein [Prevotella fusca]|uniref:nuclease-related domain-containing protein n=1 Tax=Prevotella fusca TaxID=589436 RepID=UPI003F9F5DD6